MNKLKIINGDITKSAVQFIAHQVNCKTDQAKGLSQVLFKLYPYADIYSTQVKRTPGEIIIKGNG